MDFLSIAGILVAVFAIIIGQSLEGGHIVQLINLPAFLIVIGGTFGAVMLETPFAIFIRAFKISLWVVFPPKYNFEERIETVIKWGQIARKSGLLGLESVLETEDDDFSRKGLHLLIDGGEPQSIRSVLEVELENSFRHDYQAAKMFASMGGYSPTIGILGAVLGLIHVMNNLSDPSKLGPGIAVAFVATVYGVGLANIIFLPMASKLHQVITERSLLSEMILEGVIAISEGENPRVIEMKLRGFGA